ncbi:MAG: hypothetical protein QM770_25265 [Tepidisphaeraceae bacterium]
MASTSSTSTELASAIETFVRGFATTQSITHPYVPQRVGPAWVMRDGPRTSGEYRREEWAAHGVAPRNS